MHKPLHLSAAILARWWRSVASTKALDVVHRAMCTLLYWRTTAAIKTASKVDPFFCHHFVCCCPGGRRGYTKQVVTQWWHSVASRVALDMSHWEMSSVLLWCTIMTIETANNGGTF
jgi:hypothetical protein